MKKFLYKTALYLALTLVIVNGIAWCCLAFHRNSSFYKPSFFTHAVTTKHLDYVVIGSSIGLTSIDTKQIDSLNHSRGINLSIDDTSLSSNYLMLEHFYNQGGKANHCILSISSWDLANAAPQLNDNDYRFLPFVSEAYVYTYYSRMEKGVFKPLTYSHYLPFLGVSYYNTELFYTALVAALQPEKRNRFDEKGNYTYPETNTSKNEPYRTVTLEWKNPFVAKIKALCKKNNTQLIIYQAPQLQTKVINLNPNYNFVNHSTLLAPQEGFYDNIHIDSRGRKKATAALAAVLQKDYFSTPKSLQKSVKTN